ncbi:histidine phosphatase family protein [Arthrobacter livingstonensis]|uniref:histidine phosphatase family protein n=1 Tax=Arthrobacter livingstonensis TaxID=670078 RepID=UPI001FE469AD|nr:histidine phosphatase family protein [Arthrobacter livingstonensis]
MNPPASGPLEDSAPAGGTQSVLQPAGPRRRVIFWRHGRTAWNAARRFQGQSDIPLDDVGERQAERSAALLAGKLAALPAPGAVRIISSDLARAFSTAQALSVLTGVPISVDRRLRETYGGRWEGLSFEEIERAHPAELKLWQLDEPNVRAGGGETRTDVASRMVAAILEAMAGLPEGGTLVVATHGGATRVALAKLLGLPENLWRTLSGLSNCHWSVVEQSQPSLAGASEWHWRLTEHNVGTLPQPFEAPEDLAEPVED